MQQFKLWSKHSLRGSSTKAKLFCSTVKRQLKQQNTGGDLIDCATSNRHIVYTKNVRSLRSSLFFSYGKPNTKCEPRVQLQSLCSSPNLLQNWKLQFRWINILLLAILSTWSYIHTHTHTYIYIYIYIYT